MKHIKGPWGLNEEHYNSWGGKQVEIIAPAVDSTNFKNIAIGAVYDSDIEECLNTAKLISKAPEMLEALKTIRDAFWSEGEKPKEQVQDLKSIAENILNELK